MSEGDDKANSAPVTTAVDFDDSGSLIPEFVTGFQIAMTETAVILSYNRFRLKTLPDGTMGARNETSGGISMTHVLAKDLLNVLEEAISDFEKQNFSIPNIGRFKDK